MDIRFISRLGVMAAALASVGATPEPKLRFIMPAARVMLLGPSGSGDVLVQAYIPRHPDNRAYLIECSGVCAWRLGPDSIDGEYDEAVRPRSPQLVQIHGAGKAEFRIVVYGPGGKVRDSHTMEMKVCGGDPADC